MARLASHVWVGAYRMRLEAAGIPAFVAKRGDPTAGAVIVKVATMDGRARAFHRSFDLATGDRAWLVLAEGAEADVDAALERQKRFDPDLWIVEIEDPQGRDLLEEPGFEA